MVNLSDIKVVIAENDGKKGVFKIGPFPRGFGNTFANSFRRVLLSSIPGGGVTSIRITGVDHEYSVIKGVKETVIEIQLNIKAIRFSCESDEPQVVRLKKKGAGVVTAGDLDVTGDVLVMDKKAKIATITDKTTTLEMELVVERGTGYHPADESLRSEAGRLPMHCDFSPIERVTFDVEETRKGKQLDLDLVVLTVFTDGSIDPLSTLGKASEILRALYDKVVVASGVAEGGVVTTEAPEVPVSEVSEAENWLLEDLPISKRSKTKLGDAGFVKVGDVVAKTASELLAVPGFGDAALKELKTVISEYGLSLKE
jgi:DNA-directed RNA polymerase subunit alpha